MHSHNIETYQEICNQDQDHTDPANDLKFGFWKKKINHAKIFFIILLIE